MVNLNHKRVISTQMIQNGIFNWRNPVRISLKWAFFDPSGLKNVTKWNNFKTISTTKDSNEVPKPLCLLDQIFTSRSFENDFSVLNWAFCAIVDVGCWCSFLDTVQQLKAIAWAQKNYLNLKISLNNPFSISKVDCISKNWLNFENLKMPIWNVWQSHYCLRFQISRILIVTVQNECHGMMPISKPEQIDLNLTF